MAAPHVAGAAAVLVSRFKAEGTAYTPQKIKDILKQSSVDITKTSYISPFDQGAGRLNIPAACSLTTLVTPMHLNFGFVVPGTVDWVSDPKFFMVTNNTVVEQTYTLSADSPGPHWAPGITIEILPTEQVVQAGNTASFQVRLRGSGPMAASPWPSHAYETRLTLNRQALGETSPTPITRPWILFTAGCSISVQVRNFFSTYIYIVHTDNALLYYNDSVPDWAGFVRCNQFVHVTFWGVPNPGWDSYCFLAEENLDPALSPQVSFDPSQATHTLVMEPQDKHGNILPTISNPWGISTPYYTGYWEFIREALSGKPIGLYGGMVFISQTIKFGQVSPNYRTDLTVMATNGEEFYSASRRYTGMDGDTIFRVTPADYVAPAFRFPRPSCDALMYSVEAKADFLGTSDLIPRINPIALDFAAGALARPYWFTPTMNDMKVAHNLVFYPKGSSDPARYWSRALDSSSTSSPLNSFRLNKGIDYPNVTPQQVLDSNTIPLMVGPYLWNGVILGIPYGNRIDGGVNVTWEDFRFADYFKNPWTPMFATPDGDFFSDRVDIFLTESDGVTIRDLSQTNILAPRFYTPYVPLGWTRMTATSLPYVIAGVTGQGAMQADFYLDDAVADNSPPFIRSFVMTLNGQASDILQAGQQNLIRFNLGDKTRWDPGMIASVELYYQPLGSSDPWQSLTLTQDGSTWSTDLEAADLNNPSDKAWINLRLVAMDTYGNSLTYTMSPAFMFNPWPDYDGDGVEDIHEDNDANDTYTNKPTSDPLVPEPHGLPGKCPGACYFGDADGNGMIDLNDLKAINDYLNGYPWTYDNINPPLPEIQDLDGDTILGSTDINLYHLILNNRLTSLPGAPTDIDLVSPLDVPQVSVGDTIPIEVEVRGNYGYRLGRPGFGVAFEVKQGQATLLGGDGPAYACSLGARYDISATIFDYGRARMVVQVDGEGTILVDVYIPSDPVLKFPLVRVDAPVEITGVP